MNNKTGPIGYLTLQASTITRMRSIPICVIVSYPIGVMGSLLLSLPNIMQVKSRFKGQALAAVVLFCSFQVSAQDQVWKNSQLAESLLAWIGENSSYDTTKVHPPNIVEMNPVQITAEFYSDNPELSPADHVDNRVKALYDFEKGSQGTIYVLGAEWTDDGAAPEQSSWADPIFQERVLHELVHHVQRASGAYKTFPCRNYGEREAYKLGGIFLKKNHAIDPLPNRIFWSRVYSRC